MSGGAFDYYQYRIGDIIDRIEEEIERATCERPPIVKCKFVNVIQEYERNGCKRMEYLTQYNFKDINDARAYFDDLLYGIHDTDDGFTCELSENNIIVCREVEVEEYEKDENGDDQYFPDYTEETIAEFRKGVEILKKAEIYAQRIDWLISGDDAEESFHKRLREDLSKVKSSEH